MAYHLSIYVKDMNVTRPCFVPKQRFTTYKRLSMVADTSLDMNSSGLCRLYSDVLKGLFHYILSAVTTLSSTLLRPS